jgi:hypothetical protein
MIKREGQEVLFPPIVPQKLGIFSRIPYYSYNHPKNQAVLALMYAR